MKRLAILTVVVCGWLGLPSSRTFVQSVEPVTAGAADEAAVEFYEKRVRPILAANCYECHGDDQQESGLAVTSVDAMLRGGDQGPAIVPGDADGSLLIQGIRYDVENFQMPPKAKLSTEQIAVLEKWVTDGALGPDERRAAAGVKKFDLVERAKHWCFQPIANPRSPAINDAAWPRDSLDRFVLAKLEAAALPPAAEADPRTLLRRAYFDVVGLPPSPDVVEDFASAHKAATGGRGASVHEPDRDQQSRLCDEAYEQVVDELLASPHFGERWGRHWLDLVRYAETRGHEFDMLIPNAYQYRDYVIRALNADVPYDRFVVEHLAGDLVPEPRVHPTSGANESILGTGFWWLGEEVHSPVDIRQDETDRVDNKVDVLSKTFLGLTVACARCHDHKFDAITTKDYYALSGFALGMSYRQAAFETDLHNRRIYGEVKRLEAEHRAVLQKAQYELWRPMLERADDYLEAVNEVALAKLKRKITDAERDELITAAAERHGLDRNRLAAFFQVSRREPAPSVVKRVTALPGEWRVLYDGATVSNRDWFVDGLVFGDGPRTWGELRIGTDPARPIAGFFADDFIGIDRKWDFVQVAQPNESDGCRIAWQQTGRTLKTPAYRFETGKVAFLVRGSAHVYVEVDSHRTNRGPLHAALVKHIRGDDQLRWVTHDLSAYRGERVHFEFSPFSAAELTDGQSAEFALGGIVEGEASDAVIPEPMPQSADASNILAAAVQKVWLEFGEAIRDGRSLSDEQIEMADMLLRQPDIWNTPSAEAAALVEPFFRRQAELLAQLKTTSHTAPCALEGGGVDEHVLVRGQHKSPGDLVPRRFLEALDGTKQPNFATASGRLELAERIVGPDNPLAARVIVNRVWHHLLGRGIVRTVDNFGIMGDAPTHPELLDHLAREFMADGWSVKRLIRRIMLSSTYRMASTSSNTAHADEIDPKNDLFHRANVKRLDAEVIRDALLATAGRLDPTMFGPGVEAYLTSFMEGRGRPGKSGPLDGDGRRSIYLRVRRNFLNPMFQAFDYPTPFTTIGRRTTSNVPAQALALLNGELVNELAAQWATRMLAEVPSDADARIDRMYREAFARPPTDDERTAAGEFLREQQAAHGATRADDPRSWTDLCHVLFNVKEFIYLR